MTTFVLDGTRHTIPLEKYHKYPSWCSTCDKNTEHVFGYYRGHWNTCLVCYPEAKEIVAH